MALTEAGLWPYRGESWREKGERGEADGVCLHTEVCCPLSSLQAYGQSIRTHQRKKNRLPLKKQAGKVPLSLSGSRFFRLEVRHATFDW